MKMCDKCNKPCKKTPYGSCVILCKENVTLCISCNTERLNYNKFLQSGNLIKQITNRQINGKLMRTT